MSEHPDWLHIPKPNYHLNQYSLYMKLENGFDLSITPCSENQISHYKLNNQDINQPQVRISFRNNTTGFHDSTYCRTIQEITQELNRINQLPEFYDGEPLTPASNTAPEAQI